LIEAWLPQFGRHVWLPRVIASLLLGSSAFAKTGCIE
jgi:hypothetical protein